MLNKALLYTRENESTVAALVIVHCHTENAVEEDVGLFQEFQRSVELGACVRAAQLILFAIAVSVD